MIELTREQVLEYASTYVDAGDTVDFPGPGDLFATIARELTPGKELTEIDGWMFAGYHVLRRYLRDERERPEGKWLTMEYLSLLAAPPQLSVLRLQPPHVVLGKFHSADRTIEYRFINLSQDDDMGFDKLSFMLKSPFDAGGAKRQRRARKPRRAETGAGQNDTPDNVLRFTTD